TVLLVIVTRIAICGSNFWGCQAGQHLDMTRETDCCRGIMASTKWTCPME
ncbi:hypothetical protein CRM22_001365, partial [Opisthorchis felineus]